MRALLSFQRKKNVSKTCKQKKQNAFSKSVDKLMIRFLWSSFNWESQDIQGRQASCFYSKQIRDYGKCSKEPEPQTTKNLLKESMRCSLYLLYFPDL